MKQAIIELKKKLLLVELPEGANRLQIFHDIGRPYISYFHKDTSTDRFYLKEDVEISGKLTDITEEQFGDWVEEFENRFENYDRSIGYTSPGSEFNLKAAKESFFSYLEANEIYFEANEYDFNGCNIVGSYKKHVEFWQEAQEKVWDINNTWIFQIIP